MSDDDSTPLADAAMEQLGINPFDFDTPANFMNALAEAERSIFLDWLQSIGILTFDRFREANVARGGKWHPGFPADDGWTGGDWANAMGGEIGELAEELEAIEMWRLLCKIVQAGGHAADTVKKMRRSEESLRGVNDPEFDVLKQKLAMEAADVATYLDLLCAKYNIDLGAAIVEKFNKVSEKQGFEDRL